MMQELAETLSEPPRITPIAQIITCLAKGVNKKSNNSEPFNCPVVLT